MVCRTCCFILHRQMLYHFRDEAAAKLLGKEKDEYVPDAAFPFCILVLCFTVSQILLTSLNLGL